MGKGEQEMSRTKIVSTGIVFTFLTAGMLGLSPPPLDSGANFSKEELASVHQNDVRKMQQTLRDKGHYRGKVDGVFGLRTRASIRGFQKAENLPVTGHLDSQTAGKLGIRPEAIKRDSNGAGQETGEDHEETGRETTTGKPSAGIKWASGRSSRTPRKAVKTAAAPESAPGDREKKLQADNENHPQ